MCKSWCELILGAIILIFSFWKTTYSMWVVVAAAVILIIHSFTCTRCFPKHDMNMAKSSRSSRRSRRR